MSITTLEATRTIRPEYYALARLAASEFRMADSIRQKIDQQFGAWDRHEMKVPAELSGWHREQTTWLSGTQDALLKTIEGAWQGTDVARFVAATPGLGPALLLVLSLAPELDRFPNPAKLWKYLGLHATRAKPREYFETKKEFEKAHKYSKQLKAWCLFRVAEPSAKMAGSERKLANGGTCKTVRSPYRDVYEARRNRLEDMLPAGECEFCDAARAKRKQTGKAGWDCKNMGGPHWKPAHARTDALGVTAKAILLDAWRVAHGLDPKHGSL